MNLHYSNIGTGGNYWGKLMIRQIQHMLCVFGFISFIPLFLTNFYFYFENHHPHYHFNSTQPIYSTQSDESHLLDCN